VPLTIFASEKPQSRWCRPWALHDGHVSLVRLAKRHASRVEDGPLRILVAAKLGAMRLIDNIAV